MDPDVPQSEQIVLTSSVQLQRRADDPGEPGSLRSFAKGTRAMLIYYKWTSPILFGYRIKNYVLLPFHYQVGTDAVSFRRLGPLEQLAECAG